MVHIMNAVDSARVWATLALALLVTMSAPRWAGAQTVPASTTLSVRTLDSLSGDPKTRGRAVRVMVLVPLYQDSRLLVAPRTILEGTVADAGMEKSGGTRHFLQLSFTSMRLGDGTRVPISAQVASGDDSRETVDAQGRIPGPVKPSLVRDRRDWAALALGTINPVAGAVFFAAMRGEAAERHRCIAYAPGTDMTVRVMSDVALPAWPVFTAPDSVAGASKLRPLLARLPLRAAAVGGRIPGDFVNVVFIASDDELFHAFQVAEWDSPERMSTRSDFETFIKAAKGAGYAYQPVSRQLMFGRAPDLVYQRVTDTFAKRHHIRLWRTGEEWQSVPVWVAAATHDIGVEFSRQHRSFTHRIDDAIDGERDKVVSDLIAALQVQQLSMVQRAPVPDHATRGSVSSDWGVAVMRLRPTAPSR